MQAKFPRGTFDVIAKVLESGEDRTSFVRLAVEREVARRLLQQGKASRDEVAQIHNPLLKPSQTALLEMSDRPRTRHPVVMDKQRITQAMADIQALVDAVIGPKDDGRG